MGMISQAERVARFAEGWRGYFEKASNKDLDKFLANAGSNNFTVFGQWYGMNGEPWCAIFVSFCAGKTGVPEAIVPKFASCTWEGVPFFKKAGRWRDKSAYRPERGDVIFFTNDGGKTSAHVGIVRNSDEKYVYTVEGNTGTRKDADGKDVLIPNGGGVAYKSYALTSAYILGYGHPDYKIVEDTLDMTLDEARKELTAVGGSGTAHSEWASEAIAALTEAGIFSGDGQGNFGWGQCVTREGLAVALFNVLGRLGLAGRLRQGEAGI